MMRGGASGLAARVLLLVTPVVGFAQGPIRTRDASFATVQYDNGLSGSAFTLFEGVALHRDLSSAAAYGLLSLFDDGRFSFWGALETARRSQAITAPAALSPLFHRVRSEMALDLTATAQTGFMPTLGLTGRSRLLFEQERHGLSTGAAIARSFDGRTWHTTVLGEVRTWRRRGSTLLSVLATPMQLSGGDFLFDLLGGADWSWSNVHYGASLGMRLGEADRGTRGWGGLSVTWPLRDELWATFSLGRYPADLVQNLPGGRYAAISFRLPEGRFPPLRGRPPAPPPPEPEPTLPVTERLALVMGRALDSLHLREIRVWAPGAGVVELMADFVDWIPVPLIRQPNGEWQGYYRVPPGLHRLNLRIDGDVYDVPTNLAREQDELLGAVALIIVR